MLSVSAGHLGCFSGNYLIRLKACFGTGAQAAKMGKIGTCECAMPSGSRMDLDLIGLVAPSAIPSVNLSVAAGVAVVWGSLRGTWSALDSNGARLISVIFLCAEIFFVTNRNRFEFLSMYSTRRKQLTLVQGLACVLSLCMLCGDTIAPCCFCTAITNLCDRISNQLSH